MSNEILAGMRSVRPPDELKRRVLCAVRAAAAAATESSREGWVLGRLDLAWVAACLVLLAGHAALNLRARDPEVSASVARNTESGTVADSELARQIGLPGLAAKERPRPARGDRPLTLDRILRADS